MMNEGLLVVSLLLLYGGIIVIYAFCGLEGLYGFNVFATILANIEVLILVNAFGMEMTLGNVMFACTFLITDIMSENHGKEAAKKAVRSGVFASVMYIFVSQLWLQYTPSPNDWAMPSFQILFANTPRLVLASLSVYVITQSIDVWLYHRIWDFSTEKFGDSRKGLWLRNNGSTLISQFLNNLLYNFFAFYGIYSMKTLGFIVISSYVIFICTSLLDTPVVYICRRIHEKQMK